MGGMQQAMLDGRNLKWQQLINRNKPWAMNGVANVPDNPLLNATVGETVRIRIINDTVWPHAMHLHGHHFRRVTAEGHPWTVAGHAPAGAGGVSRNCLCGGQPGRLAPALSHARAFRWGDEDLDPRCVTVVFPGGGTFRHACGQFATGIAVTVGGCTDGFPLPAPPRWPQAKFCAIRRTRLRVPTLVFSPQSSGGPLPGLKRPQRAPDQPSSRFDGGGHLGPSPGSAPGHASVQRGAAADGASASPVAGARNHLYGGHALLTVRNQY